MLSRSVFNAGPVVIAMVGSDGSTSPVEVTLIPMEIDGRPALQAVWKDIANRQVAEEGEERARRVLEKTSEGIVVTDPQRHILAVHCPSRTSPATPNRILLRARLEQSLRRADGGGTMLALPFLDLDLFRNVNDTLGHPAGGRAAAEQRQRHL